MSGQRLSREQVMSTLYAAMQLAPSLQTQGIQTWGRRFVPWTKVAAQPALFLLGADDEIQWQGVNKLVTLGADIVLYAKSSPDPSVPSDTAINALLDAVEAAFKPDQLQIGRYTIGGLVQWCRLNGKVEKDTGDLGPQAVATLGVEITLHPSL